MNTRLSTRVAACLTTLAVFAPPAFSAGELDFETPKPYPVITAIRPQQTVALRICAKREWLDAYVGAGALWPGPPYKLNLVWEAKKWTWAPPQHLPTSKLLETSSGSKICSAAFSVRHADFPVQDTWRVRATLQLDKGIKTGPIERFIQVLPAIVKKSTGNETVAPVPNPQPAQRKPRRG
jgi:hypothetical protein